MLLVIDTSGPICLSAFAVDGSIIASRREHLGRGHAERLMPQLEELLVDTKAQWTDITHIACTTGPGSFTGLRVGLATARGLALALNCPCQGVSVFDAFAFGRTEPLAVTLDAKRDQVWMQVFSGRNRGDGTPMAVAVDDAPTSVPKTVTNLIGSAAPDLAAIEPRFTVLDDAPSPPMQGIVGAAMKGEFTGEKPQPLYLRAPDAKPQSAPILKSPPQAGLHLE